MARDDLGNYISSAGGGWQNIPHIPAFPTQPNRRSLLPAAGTNHHMRTASAARISRGEGLARMRQAECNTTYTGPSWASGLCGSGFRPAYGHGCAQN
jgi:hypothetical protein